MIERQELHCHNCNRYVQFNLDTDLDGKHVLQCPNCGHEHCRYVNKGVVSDTRWDSRTTKPTNLTGYVYETKKGIIGFLPSLFRKISPPKLISNATYVYGNFPFQAPPQWLNVNPPAPNPTVPTNPTIPPPQAAANQMPVYYIPAGSVQCTVQSTYATYQGTASATNFFTYQAWMSTTSCTAGS